jgi:hypothetical protein
MTDILFLLAFLLFCVTLLKAIASIGFPFE